MIYQLSLFFDYLRQCWCFEELDQLAFHQNYTHYSLKSQSAFFDHTYLLSKRKFILLFFFLKNQPVKSSFDCLRFTIANFFNQQMTSTVVLRKFHQVTSIDGIYYIVDSVMILKVNNWKESLTRKWYPAEGLRLRIWWLDSNSNSWPDIKILHREFKSLVKSFRCTTGHLPFRYQTRCSNLLMYIDNINFLLRCQFIDQIWWNHGPHVWSQAP